ncbi:aminodeoxychorismate lyase, partial [Candidatus Endoriftia persephone str. Guaymas]|nr:aminodeoxychorismate lyase [Candidatus Endoriftia persephone str. Guaymas]
LEQAWQQRQPELPLKSPYEALILASIVERETGLPEERPQIAGVFIRRLQKRMRLQTDPTVIYGMGERYDGNIRRRDLKQDTPYNTYVHAGLTPTPIAMPGAAAIEAVLHPAEGDALYFVATGNGGHKFSATLEAHNQAVRKYQLKR